LLSPEGYNTGSLITPPCFPLIDQLSSLLQIIFVDLVLAGDNAIVIGLVAAKFTKDYRRKVIMYGVGVAVVLRILFALLTVQLLSIKGLLLVGGLLLLWVCWGLYKELRTADEGYSALDENGEEQIKENPPLLKAIGLIVMADLSMSLDNVLAVAGIADGNNTLLVIGLAIAVIMMTFAATAIASVLQKYKWIGYIGLAIILYVAAEMIHKGLLELGLLS
jgi:YjbE family integral membrane protein